MDSVIFCVERCCLISQFLGFGVVCFGFVAPDMRFYCVTQLVLTLYSLR